MQPIEFVVFDGDSKPYIPAYLIAEAMKKNIRIVGYDGEYEALSYYYDEDRQCMTLDIYKIERKK